MLENNDGMNGIKVSLLDKFGVSPTRVIAPIDCDDMSFSPPKGLYLAGFPWKARRVDGDVTSWEVDENLVDTVVAWSALGNNAKTSDEKIECVLEIDYRDTVPAEDLIHLASSGEFSLSLVGLPEEASAEDQDKYAQRLKVLAKTMLMSSNFSKSFYPFSNEFEALFLERLGKVDDALKMRQNWAKGLVDVKQPAGARVEYALKRTALGSVMVRQHCMEALVEHFGSEELMVEAMLSLAKPIAKRVERFAEEIKAQPKSKQDRFDLQASE